MSPCAGDQRVMATSQTGRSFPGSMACQLPRSVSMFAMPRSAAFLRTSASMSSPTSWAIRRFTRGATFMDSGPVPQPMSSTVSVGSSSSASACRLVNASSPFHRASQPRASRSHISPMASDFSRMPQSLCFSISRQSIQPFIGSPVRRLLQALRIASQSRFSSSSARRRALPQPGENPGCGKALWRRA